MSYALIQVLRRVWRPLVPVLSTAGALALFYWLAISYHATTIVAKNVQLVSVRQKKEMTKVPQHLAFDDEWVRSLRRILLVGPRSPEATDAPETVLWQIGPGPLPQLELVTPARDDAQIAIEVGASSEPNAVDLYLTPATDASWILRDTGQRKLQQWPIPPGHTLYMRAQTVGRQEQISIFSGLHASRVLAGKVQTDVYPFTPADLGKESCPGDQIDLGGADLEINTVRAVTSAPWGQALQVGLTTDRYTSVHARKRNCLRIHRVRTLSLLGGAIVAVISLLSALSQMRLRSSGSTKDGAEGTREQSQRAAP